MEPVLKNRCLLNREIAAKSYVRLLLPRSCILILTGLIVLSIAVRHTVLDIRQLYDVRLLFLLLEAVRGKPIPPEKEGMVHLAGFAVLMFIMILVLFNDISRFFR